MTAASSSRGNALLELTLVLPLLCLIGMSGIEYSRALSQIQAATAMSKEIASYAYRECIADGLAVKATQNPVHFDQNSCLAGARDVLVNKEKIAQILPGVQFRISMYTYDPASTNVSRDGDTVYGSTCAPQAGTCVSRYSAAAFTNTAELKSAITQLGTVVTAEVFAPYQPVTLLPPNFFHTGAVYATTIL